MGFESLILIRHCNRLDTDVENWQEITTNKHNVPLSVEGSFESLYLAKFLMEINIVDAIYCSPFLRCIQTAYPISLFLEKKISVDSRLSEFLNPDWNHWRPEVQNLRSIFNHYPTVKLDHDLGPTMKYPEVREDLDLRIEDFWKSLSNTSVKNPLIVSHGSPINSLLKLYGFPHFKIQRGMIIQVNIRKGIAINYKILFKGWKEKPLERRLENF